MLNGVLANDSGFGTLFKLAKGYGKLDGGKLLELRDGLKNTLGASELRGIAACF